MKNTYPSSCFVFLTAVSFFLIVSSSSAFGQTCGFSTQVTMTTPLSLSSNSEFADINGNGLLDIVSVYLSGTTSFRWFRNLGNNQYAAAEVLFTFPDQGFGSVQHYALGDINGNGRIDIAFRRGDHFFVAFNNTFGISPSFNVVHIGDIGSQVFGFPSSNILLEDVNGNGRLDLVFATAVYNGSPQEVYLVYFSNTGTGNHYFVSLITTIHHEQASFTPIGPEISRIVAGDLTGNGRTDFAFYRGLQAPNLLQSLTLNEVSNSYSITTIPFPTGFSTSSWHNALHLADLSNNGRMEIISSGINAAGSQNRIVVSSMSTSGSFQSQMWIPTNIVATESLWQLRAIDLTGNGNIDIGVIGSGGSFRFYSHPGTFPTGTWGLSQSLTGIINFNFGDINKDNRPDMVIETTSSEIATRLLNTVCIANTPPSPPQNASFTYNPYTGQLEVFWDPATDPNQPNAALTYQVGVRFGFNNTVSSVESETDGWKRIVRSGRQGSTNSYTTQVAFPFLGEGSPNPYFTSVSVSLQAVDNSYRGSDIVYVDGCDPNDFSSFELISTPAEDTVWLDCAASVDDHYDQVSFLGPLDTANWTFISDPPTGNGFINLSNAPNAITLTGSDGSDGGEYSESGVVSKYCLDPTEFGFMMFDWNYFTSDGPQYDLFVIKHGNQYEEITASGGSNNQNGTITVFLEPGKPLCFIIYSTDDCCGEGNVTISNVKYISDLFAQDGCHITHWTNIDDEVVSTPGCSTTIINRTYTIWNNFENNITYDRTIILAPSAPVITNIPDSAFYTCPAQVPGGGTYTPIAESSCIPSSSITVTGPVNVNTNLGCPNRFELKRTWTADDNCGNIGTHTLVVTVWDDQPPEFVSLPPNTTVECDGSGNVSDFNEWLGMAAAVDGCPGTVNISHSVETTTSTVCTMIEVRTVTFTATDVCGNSTTAVRTFTIEDSSPPIVEFPPDIMEWPHNMSVDPEFTGFPVVFDCSEVTIVYEDTEQSASCPPFDNTIIRMWTVTDACGNSAVTGQQNIFRYMADYEPVELLPSIVSICEGDSYILDAGTGVDFIWSTGAQTQSIEVSSGGTYSVSVTTIEGCMYTDETQVFLYLNPQPQIGGPETLCTGNTAVLSVSQEFESYFWSTGDETQSIVISNGGWYYVTVSLTTNPTCYGVDSFFVQSLETPPVVEQTVEICQGETYTIGNNTYSSPGTYFDTLEAANGCDSIVITTLQYFDPVFTSISAAFCTGGSYNFNGTILTQPGIYYDTLQTPQGCDSIIELTLEESPVITVNITEAICDNEAYEFDGQFLTESGTYSATFQTSQGCDSVVNLTLIVHPTYSVQINAMICEGDEFAFNGELLTETGEYVAHLSSVQGCDSTVILLLSVAPVYEVHMEVFICEDDEYDFNGQVLTEEGTYYDSLETQLGCDSVIVLHLFVWPQSVTEIEESICAGGAYDFNGTLLDESGTYTAILEDVNGCDSVVILHLTVFPAPVVEIQASICEGEEYNFNGQIVFETGVYTDTLTTADGCDSIVVLNLSVHPVFVTPVIVEICAGQTYLFHGQELTEPGQYTALLSTQFGCDSLIELTLMVSPALTENINASICEGETYFFGNQQLTQAGVYQDTLESQFGCDSIVILTLTVHPVYTVTAEVTICDNETYLFGGQQLSQPGTYFAELQSVFGCDSLVTLHLSVIPAATTQLAEEICDNAFYVFNGEELTETGIYTAVFQAANGCDSTVTLSLTVQPTYTTEIEATICSNEPYDFHGELLTQSGTYQVTLSTVNGCDSVVILELTVLPAYLFTLNEEICQNETYVFFGQTLQTSGVYIQEFTAQNGCDSVFELNLTVHPTYETVIEEEICFGDVFTFHGVNYSTSGVYPHMFESEFGCDSTEVLVLSVLPENTTTIEASICEGDEYEFEGEIYTQAGTYSHTYTTSQGCDSTLVLVLTVHPVYTVQISDEICQGLSYSFFDQQLTQSGTYSHTLTTVNGCDSTIVLNLNVFAPTATQLNVTICEGGSYNFEGNILTIAGTYIAWLTAADGCDSLVMLNLSIATSIETQDQVTICEGESYPFGSLMLTQPGVYTQTFTSQQGCDSIVTLTLSVLPLTVINTQATICEGESYDFNGELLTTPGTYTDTSAGPQGCPVVTILVLTVNPVASNQVIAFICEGETYVFGDLTLTQSGTYTQTFQTTQGCDSIVELTLTVHPVYETEIEDAICEGEEYLFFDIFLSQPGTYTHVLSSQAGCDSVIVLHLTVYLSYEILTSASFCAGGSYMFNGQVLEEPGTYTAQLTTVQGCDSIIVLTLTQDPPIVTTISAQICEGESYDFNGQLISESGTYMAEFVTAEGCDSTVMLILDVSQTFNEVIVASICEGEFYPFFGQMADETGTYSHVVEVAEGCDSLFVLELTVNSHEFSEISATIFLGQTYDFNGNLLTESGEYVDTLQAENGCDSIILLSLTVLEAGTDTLNVTICEGEFYEFGGEQLTQPGTYSDTTITDDGATIIIVLILEVNPSYSTETTWVICEGEALDFYGTPVTESGTYEHLLLTTQNCDSIIIWHVTVIPAPQTELDLILCEGDTIFFNNLEITEPGIYHDTIVNDAGCNEITTLSVTLNPITVTTVEAEICEGDEYEINGTVYQEAGTYTVILQDVAGCDSIVILQLTVNPTYSVVVLDTICSGQVYVLGNMQLQFSGNYVHTYQSVNGCDSTVFLQLYVAPAYVQQIDMVVCFGESVVINGNTYSEPGIYVDSLTSVYGCDSILMINISMEDQLAPVIQMSADSVCEGGTAILNAGPGYDSYLWSTGETTSSIQTGTAGTYMVTVTLGACESIAVAEFAVVVCDPLPAAIIASPAMGCTPLSVAFSTDQVPQGTSFHWNFGNGLTSTLAEPAITYGVPGTYQVELTLMNGLQSSMATLEVDVNEPDTWTLTAAVPDPCLPTQTSITATAANGTQAVAWQWMLGDGSTSQAADPLHVYPAFGSYLVYLELTDEHGCIVQILQNIVVNDPGTVPAPVSNTVQICPGESYNGTVYFTDSTIVDINEAASGCDSVVITHVQVLPALQQEIQETICAGEQLIVGGMVFNQSGTYLIAEPNAAGCDNLYTLHLMVLEPIETFLESEICLDDTLFVNGIAYHAGNPSGTQVFTAANGCDSLVHVQLSFEFNTISLLPDGGNHALICEGSTQLLNAGSGTAYLWSTGATTQTIEVITSGIYYVTVSQAQGCAFRGEAQVWVQLPPAYEPDAGDDLLVCGTTGQLSAMPLPSGVSGFWTGPEGVLIVSPFSHQTEVLGLAEGPQEFIWTVSSANGICPGYAFDQVMIVAYDRVNDSNLAYTGEDILFCEPVSEIQLNASSEYPGTDVGLWVQLSGPFSLNITDPNNPVSTITGIEGEGIFELEWQLWNEACGIYSRDTLQIVTGTQHLPQAQPFGPFESCGSDTLVLPVQVVSGAVGAWSVGAGNAILEQFDGFWLAHHIEGSHLVLQWALSTNDCPDFSSTEAEVILPVGPLQANHIQYILPDDGLFEGIDPMSNDSIPVYPGNWVFSIVTPPAVGVLTHVGNQIFTYHPPPDLEHTVTFVYRICNDLCDDWCSAATVALTPQLLVPGRPNPPLDRPSNVITPNDDGIGDAFMIPNFHEIQGSIRLTIVNRWGDLVYDQYPYDNNWQGTSNSGNPLPEGTYYYLIQLASGGTDALDESGALMGTVTILR